MHDNSVELSIRGKIHKVPAVEIDGRKVIVTGGWLRTAGLFDEEWQAGAVDAPKTMVETLKERGVKADIFTFAQKLPDSTPKFQYPMTWQNLAVAQLTTYDAWWEGLPQVTRKNVRRAGRRGLVVRQVEFDDALVAGIKKLYDEVPVRQGRKFWHYGKNLETIKRENSSYLDRCHFIGAFYKDELVGFIKTVYVGKASIIMQILSANEHYDKRPANALLAKGIELAVKSGMSYFVYGQYIHGRNNDAAVTEFKRRNGFEQVLLPRYYVPLTAKGKACVLCRMHLGLRHFIPGAVDRFLLKTRARLLEAGRVPKPALSDDSGD